MGDAEDLVTLAADLRATGVDEAIVTKAVAHVRADVEDVMRWGAIAVDFRNAGKFFAADVVFTAATERFPDSARLWSTYGAFLLWWDKLDAAEACLARALAIDAGSLGALCSMAKVKQAAGDDAAAAIWFGRFLEREPDNIGVISDFATCCARAGQMTIARQAFATVLAVEPDHAHTLFNFASALYQERAFDDAAALIDRLLALDPNDRIARELRARIAAKPVAPEPLPPPAFSHRATTLRGSMNAGYTGKATAAHYAHTPANTEVEELATFHELEDQPSELVRAVYGYRTADIVEMNRSIHRAAASSNAAHIFLSYRRKIPEHTRWVRAFADALVARGYDVALDEHLSRDNPDISVPELVAKLAGTALFVPIFTNEYAAAVEPDGMYTEPMIAIDIDDDAWVFDEWQLARHRVAAGKMKMLGVWRAGVMLPSPFHRGNVLDVRTDAAYRAALDAVFPPAR